jgi:acetylornithine deacetylase/succinyl-diaminopimelate desuccinylase-like protein
MKNDDLRDHIAAHFSQLKETLTELVKIPSVSAEAFDPAPVRQSAERIAQLLKEVGCDDVQLLEEPGAHPAVFGGISAPAGAPTVLLYAHHDVQPPGPEAEWETAPFSPFERNGRLYGRGVSDDKSGVIMHLGALSAHGGRPPVGIKVFIEGEEECGSPHLPDFLRTYSDLLKADVIVIADAGNWRVGVPALVTSLRGITAAQVEVRTLDSAVHSGQFGGAFPDALIVLSRLLASLHDDDGNVAVPGLVATDSDPLDLTETELREQMGTVPGLRPIGEGTFTSRLWTKPSISVLAIDAPPIAEAINQLVPVARAKVSMRIAPGQDGDAAVAALHRHLEHHVPWGAQVTISNEGYGDAFALPDTGPVVEAFESAMREAWGSEPVKIGGGGSIPFVAAFRQHLPDAPVILTGASDPTSHAHGPNESQNLDDLQKSVLAEAIVLRLLGEVGATSQT